MTVDEEGFRNIKKYNERERPLRFETAQLNKCEKKLEHKGPKSA